MSTKSKRSTTFKCVSNGPCFKALRAFREKAGHLSRAVKSPLAAQNTSTANNVVLEAFQMLECPLRIPSRR